MGPYTKGRDSRHFTDDELVHAERSYEYQQGLITHDEALEKAKRRADHTMTAGISG